MKTKLIEIYDEGTMIIAVCVDMNPENEQQRRGLRCYGFPCDGQPNIMLTHANGGKKASNDPYAWSNRTFGIAHNYIMVNWATLNDGDVVDVQFILGETKLPKISGIMV